MIDQDTSEFTSRQVPIRRAAQLARLLEWCQDRCGASASDVNPDGTWLWCWIDGDTVLVTLPSAELVCEMSLVEPWLDR
jgi:hypothetical protein